MAKGSVSGSQQLPKRELVDEEESCRGAFRPFRGKALRSLGRDTLIDCRIHGPTKARLTLRLLVVTDDLVLGGLQRQLALTVTNLPEQWDVRCFAVAGGPSTALLLSGGIALEIVERRWRYDPIPFLRLWTIVARWRPHLVHSWGYMTTLAGYPAFRAFGIPFIDGTTRTGDISLTRRSWCRLGFDRATLVVANSESGLLSAGVSPEREGSSPTVLTSRGFLRPYPSGPIAGSPLSWLRGCTPTRISAP